MYVIEPAIFGDHRGYFMETYNKKDFARIGLDMDFVQDNQSKSTKGVLRGLHFQVKHPQGKLVRVIKGTAYDVGVDIRKGSPTFGQCFGIELSHTNKKMLFIPEGCAHGFLVLTSEVEFAYKVTDYYYPEFEKGIKWNDPDMNIPWPLEDYGISKPILSARDESLPWLSDYASPFSYEE